MNTTINSTGTEVYLVTATTVTTLKSDCATAVGAGFRIGKITGDIALGGDLAVQEHKYLGDDTEYAMGQVTYGTISLDSPFSVSDNIGQTKLIDSFDNRTRYKMILVNTDGNYTVVPVFAKSAKKTYKMDDFIVFNCVVQQNGKAVEVTA